MKLTSINGGGVPLVTMDMIIDPIIGDAVSRSTLFSRYGVTDPALIPQQYYRSAQAPMATVVTKPTVLTKPTIVMSPNGKPIQSSTDVRIVSKYPVSQPVSYKPLIKPGAPPTNPTTAPSQAPTSFLTTPPIYDPRTSQLPSSLAVPYMQQSVVDPRNGQTITRTELVRRYGEDSTDVLTPASPYLASYLATTQVIVTNTPIAQQLVIAHQNYGYLVGPNLMVVIENFGIDPSGNTPAPISYHSVVPPARLNTLPAGYTITMGTPAQLQQMEAAWLASNQVGPSNLPAGLIGATMAPVGTQLATGTYPSLLTSFTSPGVQPVAAGEPTRASNMLAQAGSGTAIAIAAIILFWLIGKGGK